MTKQRFFLATVRPGGKEQVSCHDAYNEAYYEDEAVPGNRFRVKMEYSYKRLAKACGYVTQTCVLIHKGGHFMSASATPTCTIIRSKETYDGKQGLTYFAGISAESAGAKAICMHVLTIPPGGCAHAHLHENHETAIYVLSGEAEMWYGEALQEHVVISAGDFVYIAAGMPHLPGNTSQTEACVALIARTDTNEQESVVLLPELDARVSGGEDNAR